jgi:glutathione peroxidase
MNALQNRFKDFHILGIPCNQFALQEPGENGTEIINSLKYVRPGGGFEPNFELTEKVDVNGPDEHALYTFLKGYCPPVNMHFAPKHRLHYNDLKANDIRWNFEKFLIDRQGIPVIHYSETYQPLDIEADIRDLLMAPTAITSD